MILNEETLLEIEDYINHLEEVFGLNTETMFDVSRAINDQGKLNNLFDNEKKPFACPVPGCELRFDNNYELKEHFKNNKVCKSFANSIKQIAKKGLRI